MILNMNPIIFKFSLIINTIMKHTNKIKQFEYKEI